MKDAYALLNEAFKVWQENAITRNSAGSVKKDGEGIDLWCKTPYGWYKLNSVYFHEAYGVTFDVEEAKRTKPLYQD